jgi:hypothetical protein
LPVIRKMPTELTSQTTRKFVTLTVDRTVPVERFVRSSKRRARMAGGYYVHFD